MEYNYETIRLIDEVSETEIYIGESKNFSDKSSPIWRIKKISKNGTVWEFGFPNGVQDYTFIWNERLNYTYSQ